MSIRPADAHAARLDVDESQRPRPTMTRPADRTWTTANRRGRRIARARPVARAHAHFLLAEALGQRSSFWVMRSTSSMVVRPLSALIIPSSNKRVHPLFPGHLTDIQRRFALERHLADLRGHGHQLVDAHPPAIARLVAVGCTPCPS